MTCTVSPGRIAIAVSSLNGSLHEKPSAIQQARRGVHHTGANLLRRRTPGRTLVGRSGHLHLGAQGGRMSSVGYHARTVSVSRQLASILVALVGGLTILGLGAQLLLDGQSGPLSAPGLVVIAVSCTWMYLTLLSQQAHSHWTISDRDLHERVVPRIAWLPFGRQGERTVQLADVGAWRVGTEGVGNSQRHVIVLELRAQKPVTITSRQKRVDADFTALVAALEQRLGSAPAGRM